MVSYGVMRRGRASVSSRVKSEGRSGVRSGIKSGWV